MSATCLRSWFEPNRRLLAGQSPGLASAVLPFADKPFARLLNPEKVPFYAVKQTEGNWLPLSDPKASRARMQQVLAGVQSRLNSESVAAPLLLAGLQNGELLDGLLQSCAGRVRMWVAVESPMLLAAWLALADRAEILRSSEVCFFDPRQPDNVLQTLVDEEESSSERPLIAGMLPDHVTERLLAPLSNALLKERHRCADWQKRHQQSARDVLNGFRDEAGNFNRFDIPARCVAIESYLKSGSIGPLYRKMQRIRRQAPEGSVLLERLCRNFEELIAGYAQSGYDASCPIIVSS
ncbi:MAG: hypothetical protein PHG65_03350, partial [Kiritimatiellae bacterium]|nr:hypothetical protein [Kiritimatiellia bacterium]